MLIDATYFPGRCPEEMIGSSPVRWKLVVFSNSIEWLTASASRREQT
jgi:hypothetical protein